MRGQEFACSDSPPVHEWTFTPTKRLWVMCHSEGWWRIFRRHAFAGQSFADHTEIETATTLATHQLYHRAKPWVWGRPPRPHRQLRRRFVYSL